MSCLLRGPPPRGLRHRLVSKSKNGTGRTAVDNQYQRGKKKKEVRRFSQLRQEARDGHIDARNRLRWHVQRRIRQGWTVKTIAKRLGITAADVTVYAGNTLVRTTHDPTPRLVKR